MRDVSASHQPFDDAVVTSDRMPSTTDDAGDPRELDLWNDLEPQLRDRFGEDAEIRASINGDHIDVRVLPSSLEERLDGDLNVVPYNALRMTVRRDG